jgi:hypothetical protein
MIDSWLYAKVRLIDGVQGTIIGRMSHGPYLIETEAGEVLELCIEDFSIIQKSLPISAAREDLLNLRRQGEDWDAISNACATLERCQRQLHIALAWTRSSREPEVQLWRAEVERLVKEKI